MSEKTESMQLVADFRRYPEEWDKVRPYLEEAERRGIKKGFIARHGALMWCEKFIKPSMKKGTK